jgi:hypothetical protein
MPESMNRFRTAALTVILLAAAAAPAFAQDGFALKAGYLYNRSQVEGATDVPTASGFGLGVEYVLPGGVGLGVSAYSAGSVREFDVESGTLNVAAEANYFLRIPLLPLAPYGGVHAGFGRYSRGDGSTPGTRPDDGWRELGWQVGMRVQLLPILGLDAQFRRVSTSLETNQGEGLSREQVIIGVALF